MTEATPRLAHLLVGVDGSAQSHAALGWAARVAGATGARVTVVCAFDERWSFERPVATIVDGSPGLSALEAERLSTESAAELAAQGIRSDAVAFEGTFPQAVLELCEREHPDLVVIGGRLAGRARELLIGSNAEKVVREAPVSVLVVR